MKQVTMQWNQLSNEEKEAYERPSSSENRVAKGKNKRVKTSEGNEMKIQIYNEEHDSFKDHRSFGDDRGEFQSNKEQVAFGEKEKYSQQNKIETRKNEYFQNKNNSPNQESSIKFNLPESRPMSFNQPSPSPMPIRKDMGFANNMGPYQDMTNGSTEYSQSNAYSNMNRNAMFSPMPYMPNRSPGVSPNIVPMYSPMMVRNDNINNYSNRNLHNMQRNPTAMGQSLSTPVNKGDIGYTDFYQMSASPSGYTPIRTNLTRFNPGISPLRQPDTSSIFGPSPNIMPNLSFSAYPVGSTPVNHYGNNNQMFAPPKPFNPMMMQGNEGQRKMNPDDSKLFELNPFGG